MIKNNRQPVINKLNKIHNHVYDYSLLPNKIITKDTIRVVCAKHGEFTPKYHDHLYNKSKCPQCSNEHKKVGLTKFIQLGNLIHKNKYKYNKVKYINSYTKIIITCPIHGDFVIVPYSHTNYKTGCNLCSYKKLTKSTDIFIDEANEIHNNTYDYTKTKYTGVRDPIIITCTTHGEFTQTPTNHLHRKSGCPKCNRIGRYTTKYFDNNCNEYGKFYIIEAVNKNEHFIKIGITKHNNVNKRLTELKRIGYNTNILFQHCTVLHEAFKAEQKLLVIFKNNIYNPNIYFSGATECMNYSRELINELTEKYQEINNGNFK